MFEVFGLTLGKVAMLLVFIGIGYFMRRHHDLPDDAGHVLSLLCTLIFSPAYSISNMSKNFTIHAAKDGVVTFVKTKKTHFSGKSLPRVRVEVR